MELEQTFRGTLATFSVICAMNVGAIAQTLPSQPVSQRPDLSELRERSSASLAHQKAFFEKLAAGDPSVDPVVQHEKVVEEVGPKLVELTALSAKLLDPELPNAQRGVLSKDLFAELQMVGEFFDDAPNLPTDPRLSADQEAEMLRLKATSYEPGLVSDPEERVAVLHPISPLSQFTLQHLTVPLAVQTDPEAELYFEAINGGKFVENGLSLIKVEADDQGIARVTWISQGSAAGPADVVVTTPRYPDSLDFVIRVVQLAFPSLP